MAYDDHLDSQQAGPQRTADHAVQPPLPPLQTKEADTALPQVEVSSTESGPAANSGEGPDETEQSSPSEEEEWRSSEQDIDAYSSGDNGDGGNVFGYTYFRNRGSRTHSSGTFKARTLCSSQQEIDSSKIRTYLVKTGCLRKAAMTLHKCSCSTS